MVGELDITPSNSVITSLHAGPSYEVPLASSSPRYSPNIPPTSAPILATSLIPLLHIPILLPTILTIRHIARYFLVCTTTTSHLCSHCCYYSGESEANLQLTRFSRSCHYVLALPLGCTYFVFGSFGPKYFGRVTAGESFCDSPQRMYQFGY
ncbi:hypothetical protein F4604DRAFT_1737853 [Suillus subluteus]|nr:hypothetical protein F4604DRAFT_1737853 [Suillus subluteus]